MIIKKNIVLGAIPWCLYTIEKNGLWFTSQLVHDHEHGGEITIRVHQCRCIAMATKHPPQPSLDGFGPIDMGDTMLSIVSQAERACQHRRRRQQLGAQQLHDVLFGLALGGAMEGRTVI